MFLDWHDHYAQLAEIERRERDHHEWYLRPQRLDKLADELTGQFERRREMFHGTPLVEVYFATTPLVRYDPNSPIPAATSVDYERHTIYVHRCLKPHEARCIIREQLESSAEYA